MKSPIRYSPSYEFFEEDEARTQDELGSALHHIAETTFKHSGQALRGVHAKSHGLLRLQCMVLPGLPWELVQGICLRPREYDAIMRLSTTPGDVLDDSVSTPRGMAIKLCCVQGTRLPGTEGEETQDFVLVNSPNFAAPSAKRFAAVLKLLATTTDKAEDAKKLLSAALRGIERLIEAAGGRSESLIALGGQPATHPLGETYYSQVPILWGPYMAKLSMVPVSPSLAALADARIELHSGPDALREAVIAFFTRHAAEWELRVQLCRDIIGMPIEDPSVPWLEETSPYLPVARIVATAQAGWSEARSTVVDEGMAFSPWHGITAHRPLGAIMRLRKLAYEESASFRSRHGRVVREPKGIGELPD